MIAENSCHRNKQIHCSGYLLGSIRQESRSMNSQSNTMQSVINILVQVIIQCQFGRSLFTLPPLLLTCLKHATTRLGDHASSARIKPASSVRPGANTASCLKSSMTAALPGRPHWIVRSQRCKVGQSSFLSVVRCSSQPQRQVCYGLMFLSL